MVVWSLCSRMISVKTDFFQSQEKVKKFHFLDQESKNIEHVFVNS